MRREDLKARIETVKQWDVFAFGESQAKRAIIEPIFDCLGWDTSNPYEVRLEYVAAASQDRVDYALLEGDKPLVLVEAKRPGHALDSADYGSQLLRYAFQKGTPLAILTNGIEWWFYLPLQEGDWQTRKFYTIDLKTQGGDTVCDRFAEFLSKDNVTSGKAVEYARAMQIDKVRRSQIQRTLPKVWKTIVAEPNHILVELLVEETERKCGFKPDESQVKTFLAEAIRPPSPTEPTKPPGPEPKKPVHGPNDASYINKTVRSFTFLGETTHVRNCYEILLRICEMIRTRYPDTFEETLLRLKTYRYPCFSQDTRELMQRQGKKIPGTNIYAATKLHNDAMVGRCRLVIKSFGYNPGDLSIEVEPDHRDHRGT